MRQQQQFWCHFECRKIKLRKEEIFVIIFAWHEIKMEMTEEIEQNTGQTNQGKKLTFLKKVEIDWNGNLP